MSAMWHASEDINLLRTFLILIVSMVAVPHAYGEQPPLGMVEIPTGNYKPLYSTSDADRSANSDDLFVVQRFFIDERAVTNFDYLQFIKHQPKWQRDRIPKLFADDAYLVHWHADTMFGETAMADLPVVNISWFAANAYCRWKGKQLPTVAQWERAASASETAQDASDDPAFSQRILQWYAQPADRPLIERAKLSSYRNVFGVWDMHGLIWEWTRDFNSAMVTGESRGDSGLQRQLFCGSGSVGAADPRDYASFMRFAFRSSLNGDYTVGSLGFRCAKTPQ